MSSTRRNALPVVGSACQRSAPFFRSQDLSSSFASSSSSYHSPAGGGFFAQRRSASPTRVSLHALSSLDRSVSPGRRIASPHNRNQVVQQRGGKRTCLCAPTTHPGSFRCSLHKNSFGGRGGGGRNHSIPYSPNRLNMRRSAMTNSLVRIGTVEGDLVKRALAALIRPSCHQQRRRCDFQPRPSRLSFMSTALELR